MKCEMEPAEHDERFPPGPRLGPTLGQAAHLARSAMLNRVSQYDVTPAQTHVLLYLHRRGGQAPQCELTRFLRVRPSTANGVLDRMEEKGLIRRSVSGRDARRRILTLTEKGKVEQSAFQQGYLDTERTMVRGLSPEEQRVLMDLLDRVIQNLKEDSKP